MALKPSTGADTSGILSPNSFWEKNTSQEDLKNGLSKPQSEEDISPQEAPPTFFLVLLFPMESNSNDCSGADQLSASRFASCNSIDKIN